MAKDYIEHEIKVQFMEQYYAKGTTWQWFIDQIEKDYEFSDIVEWKDYERLSWRWLQLFSYFEKIVEVGVEPLIFNESMLKDVFVIAKFYRGVADTQEASEEVETVFGKTLFWSIWATKLGKQDNNIDCVYDNDLFTLRNMWQFRILMSLELYEDDLLLYGKNIPIIDIDEYLICLQDNIDRKYYAPREDFAKELEKTYPLHRLFGFQHQQVIAFSWQEKAIVGLINNGLNRNNRKYPIENVFGENSEEIILDRLNVIKQYFSDGFIDFLIETVLFLWIGKEPSVNSKCKYCDMWKFGYENEEHFQRFENVGFWCVSELFAKGFIADLKKTAEFSTFLIFLQGIKDVFDLQKLIEAKFPLSKEQKGILKEHQENAYKKIDDINDLHSLKEYMQCDVVCKSIDNEYFCKVREKFLKFLEDEKIQRLLPSYFYAYMVFLIRTKNMSRNVNKKEIDVTVIGIQKLWENQYYSVACKDLQTFSTKTEVSNTDLYNYNQEILDNPLAFAKICMNLDEKKVCEVMERASEHAITYMITRMDLSPIFPTKKESVNLLRHDVDGFLNEFIDRIRLEKGYRFLNQLDNNKYLLALYEDVHLRSRMCISMFNKEQVLYERLAENTNIRLLPYSEELLLAHITQLFPVLEQKIREVSSIFGVAPFKEDLNSFMQFKDPSSLLREMIEEAFKETGDFELVYDLMFVYSFMYNSNSFNVRNECIHGRKYNTLGEIKFAFKVTLLSIYMIDYRIKLVIKGNAE